MHEVAVAVAADQVSTARSEERRCGQRLLDAIRYSISPWPNADAAADSAREDARMLRSHSEQWWVSAFDTWLHSDGQRWTS